MYWQDRMSKAQDNLTKKSIKQTEKQIKKYYETAMEEVISSFEKTYAHILLSIEAGRKPTPADLYKLDTYWQMQAQLKIELQKLGDKQVEELTKRFIQQYEDIYTSIALKGESFFNTIDKKQVQEMIMQVWAADGVSWSQRVWTNTSKLQQELNEGLINCLVAGKKTSELKEILQNRFNVSYTRADTLVRTEMAHIQTQAAKNRYLDAGITEVEVWASPDERRCEVCGKLHKMRYPAGGKMPIPAHPRCRCTILPVIE